MSLLLSTELPAPPVPANLDKLPPKTTDSRNNSGFKPQKMVTKDPRDNDHAKAMESLELERRAEVKAAARMANRHKDSS